MTKEKKTAGQRLDAAIERTRHHARKTKELVQRHAAKAKPAAGKEGGKEKAGPPRNKRLLLIAAGVVAVIILIVLFRPSGDERATTAQAQDIARMLKAENVTIQSIRATRHGYEVTYAAESAVGRFDDALLADWGAIYGTAAAHDCSYVSITTTLNGEPLHRQTVGCDAVRAFVRGVLTEEEFWLLVKHESLA